MSLPESGSLFSPYLDREEFRKVLKFAKTEYPREYIRLVEAIRSLHASLRHEQQALPRLASGRFDPPRA
jgi:hypothetical protein